MLSRAQRLPEGAIVRAFDWSGTRPVESPRSLPALHVPAMPDVMPELPIHRPPVIDTAALERDAFSKGYAQGERTAQEAAAARSELVLRQVSGAIEELSALKKGILQQTERQVVQLSLAIARRIVHREVSLDRELVATMARVALDRMGQPATATIRMHPDDFAAMTHGRRATDVGPQIVADHMVQRGGCLVQSDFGVVDVSVDAQINEVGTALLGELTASDVFATEAVRVR